MIIWGENEQNMYQVIQGVKFFMEITIPPPLKFGSRFSPSLLKGHVLNHQVSPRWVENILHFHRLNQSGWSVPNNNCCCCCCCRLLLVVACRLFFAVGCWLLESFYLCIACANLPTYENFHPWRLTADSWRLTALLQRCRALHDWSTNPLFSISTGFSRKGLRPPMKGDLHFGQGYETGFPIKWNKTGSKKNGISQFHWITKWVTISKQDILLMEEIQLTSFAW